MLLCTHMNSPCLRCAGDVLYINHSLHPKVMIKLKLFWLMYNAVVIAKTEYPLSGTFNFHILVMNT